MTSNSKELIELRARVARLEIWATAFSCSAEHSDVPIFLTEEDEEKMRGPRHTVPRR